MNSARDLLVLLKCALYIEEKLITASKKKKEKKKKEKNAKRERANRESKPHRVLIKICSYFKTKDKRGE